MQYGQRRRLVDHDLSVPVEAHKVTPHITTSAYTLRKRQSRRSADLVDAISRLDTVTDAQVLKDLAAWINSIYEERGGGSVLGLFGHCYLGHPYVDHQMDLAGNITRHFTPSDVPPPAFVLARPLARSTAYLYIEVYDDGQIVPVRPDGSSAI